MIARILLLALVQLIPLPSYCLEQPDVPGQIEELRRRAMVDSDAAMSAKAGIWLDLAFEEYIERDDTGLVEDALWRARQLVGWLEARQPEGKAEPENIRGTIRVREDLWVALSNAKRDACTAPDLGRAEVYLVWAGHEQDELGKRHARRYMNEAEQLIRHVQECPQENRAQVTLVEPIVDVPATLAEAVAMLPEEVHFAYKKDEISPETDAILQRLAEVLRTYPGLKLKLVGHTDQIGGKNYNLKLSKRRAERVRQRLIELGLPEDRFITSWSGKSNLKMLPNNKDARARNRRVQFIIISDPVDDVRIETQQQIDDLQPDEKGRKR